MIPEQLALSIKAAKFASTALALLAPVRGDFPELSRSVDASEHLMNYAVSRILTNLPYRPVDGHAVEPIQDPTPAPAPKPELKSVTPKVVVRAEDLRSAWEPVTERDVSRCKALLLEILRRAAHDWVLYRQHKKMALKELADDAFTWLFEEDEQHPYRHQRLTAEIEMSDGTVVKGAREITSFLSICECLDLDPATVRARVKKMDIQTIIASGRPAETRKLQNGHGGGSSVEECGLMVDVDVDTPSGSDYVSSYEQYGSVSTPGRLTLADL